MLLKLTGICQNCASDVELLLLDKRVIGSCRSCNELPITIKNVPGAIYVIVNKHQTGVKIGMTEKSVSSRLRSLESTGVPGHFDLIAVFPSDRPKKDERRIHEKLGKYRISKEHFDLLPVDATLKVFRALNRRVPIFYDESVQHRFNLRLEADKLKMALRLSGEKVS